MTEHDALLTVEAAALVLSCSRGTVHRLIYGASPQLRAVKLGRSTRIRRSDLDVYIASLAPLVPETQPGARVIPAPKRRGQTEKSIPSADKPSGRGGRSRHLVRRIA